MWLLDGKNLSSLAWNIKDRSAGWSVPGRAGENIKVPSRHGAFWTPGKKFDEGRLSLSMWANGCEEDGSYPTTDDAKRKVRDNLDTLTSLFSTSNRLLTLRQQSDDDMVLVNEVRNPNLTSPLATGAVLATNAIVERSSSTAPQTEVARELTGNPYAHGSTGEEETVTEDLFPDPNFWQYAKGARTDLLRNYYFPIKQDVTTTNQFFTAYNGFQFYTGLNGVGAIAPTVNVAFSDSVRMGEIVRDVSSNRASRSILFMRIRLNAGTTQTSTSVLVTPQISLDGGTTWATGAATSYTVTKNFSWIIVPASKLPTVAAGYGYKVRYIISTSGAQSFARGIAYVTDRVGIQDSPEVGNPWLGTENEYWMINGSDTLGVSYLGTTEKSVSSFRQVSDPTWVKVNTGSQAGTAPYAYAWVDWATSGTIKPQLNFSVMGGNRTTFRKDLPIPTLTTEKVRIWGRFTTTQAPMSSVFRVSKKNSDGSYTEVVSVTTYSGKFVSAPFTATAGTQYAVEIEVPSTPDSLAAATSVQELHVSNGYVSTIIPQGKLSATYGPASRSSYSGEIYKSTILGRVKRAPAISIGVPAPSAKEVTTTAVDWGKEISIIYPEGGVVGIPSVVIPSGTTTITARVGGRMGSLPAMVNSVTLPSVVSAPISLTIFNSDGTSRTVTASGNFKASEYNAVEVTTDVKAGDQYLTTSITYINESYPAVGVNVEDFSVYSNRPSSITFFSGSQINGGATWPKASRWVGKQYFSQSVLSAPIPATWKVTGFSGFDSDNSSVRFTGGSVRVYGALKAGASYIGYRRGSYTGDLTVSAKPEGAASATSLGTITSTKDFTQGSVTIPEGATYVDFIISGGSPYKTIRDVFALIDVQSVYPISPTSWAGLTPTSYPTITLPTHPSSRYPTFTVVKRADGTSSMSTGTVVGWTGSVLSGGFIPTPSSGSTATVATQSVPVSGGYATGAVKIQPTAATPNRVKIEIQGSTSTGPSAGVWTTLVSKTITTTAYQEIKMGDVSVTGYNMVRLAIVADNATSPVTTPAFIAIIDGATLVPSALPLGSTFPGVFTGVRSSGGTSTYRGTIRQCFVEVIEAIDMQSTGLATIAEFAVNMVVPGAFWEDVYDTVSTVTAQTGATKGVFYMADFNGATAPMADLVFEVAPVSGSITSLTLTDKGSGNYLTYSGPAQAKIVIDADKASVQSNSGASLARYVPDVGSSTILSLTPFWRGVGDTLANHVDGMPVLEWSSNVPIKVTVAGRRKYLIA